MNLLICLFILVLSACASEVKNEKINSPVFTEDKNKTDSPVQLISQDQKIDQDYKAKDIVVVKQILPLNSKVEKTYTVEIGDTLQKISQKLYGTTRKWPHLFELNKENLKNADTLSPDIVIVVEE